MDELIVDDDDVTMATITIAELRVGVLLSTDKRRASRLAFVDEIPPVVPVLDQDRAVAEAHAELLGHVRREGRPGGAHDLVIAATVKAVANRAVVSAEAAAFANLLGVEVRHHR